MKTEVLPVFFAHETSVWVRSPLKSLPWSQMVMVQILGHRNIDEEGTKRDDSHKALQNYKAMVYHKAVRILNASE